MRKKIKILLVYPNIPMMLVTPLSIAIFTWILRQEGFEVDLFDTTQYGEGNLSSPQNRVKYLQARNIFTEKNLILLKSNSMENDFKLKLEAFKPDILLYSFTEDALGRALQLLRVSNTFNIPTVVGGVLATADPDWLILFPEISMIGVGEGEEVVRELALRLSQGRDFNDIANLWIKLSNGSVLRNPIRPYVNLTDYFTDFSLFDEVRFERPMGGKIHRALPIETYRGCPNSCTFCNSPMHNRIAKEHNWVYLRRKSIEWMRKEIKHLLDDYNVNLLYFIDDSFLARPLNEIKDFIEMYKEFRVPFWFNTRPEDCALDILKKLKEVGLFRVSFGVESGNAHFREKYLGRRVSNEKLLHYFNIISDSGIDFSINYIIGFPFETREMVFDSIRLAKQIKGYDSITVSIFTPYRGTILRQAAIEAGWLDPDALTTHTTASSIFKMPLFTSRQIDGLIRTFPLYVEFEESLWAEIGKAEMFEPGGEEILAKYSELYKKRRWEKKRA
ncbi:MAG: radical SAM protein [Patescibacteria group bacterium]